MLTKQEIRQLHDRELGEELTKASRELMRTKMDLLSGSTKESHKLKDLKKYVARLQTIMRENDLQQTSAASLPAKKTLSEGTIV